MKYVMMLLVLVVVTGCASTAESGKETHRHQVSRGGQT